MTFITHRIRWLHTVIADFGAPANIAGPETANGPPAGGEGRRPAMGQGSVRLRSDCDQRLPAPLPDRTGMLLRMCESGSSPLDWVEFSAHCWFCGLARTLMSWTVIGTRPMSEPTLTLTGRPTQGLFRVPWIRPICGLWVPSVWVLPYSCSAPLPFTVVVPSSLPMAMACGAAVAPTAMTEAARAAPASIFLIIVVPFLVLEARFWKSGAI